ncbi:hypothetical protein BDE02_05G104800 [Populus trichocarpa]|nr:hypothetical protein BDE02_05G104800 [Populus trichocarpa]
MFNWKEMRLPRVLLMAVPQGWSFFLWSDVIKC